MYLCQLSTFVKAKQIPVFVRGTLSLSTLWAGILPKKNGSESVGHLLYWAGI